jgi:hypothetical protein
MHFLASLLRSASLDSASLGTVTSPSPHKGVKSISSKGSTILTSDLLGSVALWEAKEDNSDVRSTREESEGDQDLDRQNNWYLDLIDNKKISCASVALGGERSKKRLPCESVL